MCVLIYRISCVYEWIENLFIHPKKKKRGGINVTCVNILGNRQKKEKLNSNHLSYFMYFTLYFINHNI